MVTRGKYSPNLAGNLELARLKFGKTDARSEIVSRDETAREFFINSFTLPSSTEIGDLFKGDRYFVYGSKGSGKTAFLRYLSSSFKKQGNPTKFIIFSEDMSKSEKDFLLNSENFDLAEKPALHEEIDVTEMWHIYIYRKIVDILVENPNLSNKCKNLSALQKLFSDMFYVNSINSIDKIRNTIKNGRIKFTAKLRDYLQMEFSGEVSDDKKFIIIDYSELIKIIEKKISLIEFPADVNYYIFFDELNLSMMSKKQHMRDSILIRDIILSVGRINNFFSEMSIPVYIYAAIRTEILSSRNVSQNEINKYMNDRGLRLRWIEGNSPKSYPIVRLIENKIRASEKEAGFKQTKNDKIWTEYFSRDIFGIDPKIFISEMTWCNPRDIVNMLGAASKSQFKKYKFDTKILLSCLPTYSTSVWQERVEELSAEYSASEIRSIKRLLTGFHGHFKLNVFESHAKNLAERDQLIMQLNKTKGMHKVCEDLYYIGVLGNSYSAGHNRINERGEKELSFVEKWFHRSGSDFDANSWIIIHKGLWPELHIGSISRSIFSIDENYEV